jgi:photosystem II stability/assembly factor-like uncharacterized protein
MDSIDVVVYRSSDDGVRWSLVKTPKLTVPMSSVSGISCVNRDDCIVTGDGVLKTRDGGASWTSISLRRYVLDAVTCLSKSDCIAMSNVTSAVPSNESGSIYATADFGSLWKSRLSGGRVTDLDGVSCPSASRCVSVGGGYNPKGASQYTSWGAIETTRDAGTSWHQQRYAGVSYFLDVSCAKASPDCVAVGVAKSAGAILRSTDYGASWKPVPAP